jgi:hypothetical protein
MAKRKIAGKRRKYNYALYYMHDTGSHKRGEVVSRHTTYALAEKTLIRNRAIRRGSVGIKHIDG